MMMDTKMLSMDDMDKVSMMMEDMKMMQMEKLTALANYSCGMKNCMDFERCFWKFIKVL